MQKYYSGGLQMNNEVERYVGELRELREENDSLKNRVKQLEEEVAWRTKYGDYMNHQHIMSSAPKEEKKENIKINKVKNKFFSGSLRY
tara:strand:- start:321 stop:584 length:264 start_codon:yes stop_codon:yes gene_type:complete